MGSTRLTVRAFAFRAAIALLTTCVVVLAALAARLAMGPISLAVLIPAVEETANRVRGGISAHVANLQLDWNAERTSPVIRATDVTLRASNGKHLARLPAVDIGVDPMALLGGRIVLRSLELRHPQMSVIRDSAGRWQLAPTPTDAGAPDPGGAPGPTQSDERPDDLADVSRLLRGLGDPGGEHTQRPTIEELRVTDGELTVEDQVAGATWTISDLGLQLATEDGGLKASMKAALPSPNAKAWITATLSSALSNGDFDLSISFHDLMPSALAVFSQRLRPADRLRVPLDVRVTGILGENGQLLSADFAVTGRAGSVRLAEASTAPLSIRSVHADGAWDAKARTLQVESAVVEVGTAQRPGPRLEIAVNAVIEDAGTAMVFGHVAGERIEAGRLAEFWPQGLAADARAWITSNITAGTVERANVDFEVGFGQTGAQDLALREIAGTLSYEDLEVHFMRPLPPITGIDGEGTFDAGGFRLSADGAALEGLTVGGAHIDITGLEETDQNMALKVSATGPVRELLSLLDHPRLDFITGRGIDPTKSAGAVEARGHFAFPLLADLPFEDVDLSVKGTARELSLRNVLFGLDVADGKLEFELDKAQGRFAGPLAINGVPAIVDLREGYAETVPYLKKVAIWLPSFDETAFAAFDIDIAPILTGSTSVDVNVTLDRSQNGTADIAMDLARARLSISALDWQKPAGVAGTLTATVAIEDRRAAALPSIVLSAGTLQGEGSARLHSDGSGIQRVELKRLALGRTDLRDIVAHRRNEGFAIAIGGGTLDASAALAEDAAGAETANGDGIADVPLTLSAEHLRAVYLGKERSLHDVSIAASRTGAAWTEMRVTGTAQSPSGSVGDLSASFGPSSEGRTPVLVEADPAGAILSGLDIVSEVVGGRLWVSGAAQGPDLASPITAKVVLEDFSILPSSAGRKALSATGIAEQHASAADEPMRFDRLEADVVWHEGVVTVESAKAYNASLAISVHGTVDTRRQSVDLRGTAVPWRRLNRLLGSVPVIGGLLGGGDEGLIAVKLTIAGAPDDPEVQTDVIDALTPDLLHPFRSLLGGGE